MRKGSPTAVTFATRLLAVISGPSVGGVPCSPALLSSGAPPRCAAPPGAPPLEPRPRGAEDSGSLGPARGAGIRGPVRARHCLAPRARWGRRAPGGERSGRGASPPLRVLAAAPAPAAARDPASPRAPLCHLQDTLSVSQHRLLAVPAQPIRRPPAASAVRPPP